MFYNLGTWASTDPDVATESSNFSELLFKYQMLLLDTVYTILVLLVFSVGPRPD